MLDSTDRSARAFSVGDTAKIRCRFQCHAAIENPTIGFIIRDRLGNDIFGTNTHYLKIDQHAHRQGECASVMFTARLNIGSGNYSLCIAVHTGHEHIENNYDWWDQCLVFQVIPNNLYSFVGCAALPVEASIEKGKRDD